MATAGPRGQWARSGADSVTCGFFRRIGLPVGWLGRMRWWPGWPADLGGEAAGVALPSSQSVATRS